ncbi:Eco57I restriction-modification methylase domain-containing protein [Psychroflexus lacisalsi]|uniref:site-specific DNA-methyltransferase (adenine-specific) n=1 Tax=Psychroflexus lacisalsi TaxID=503928 RepID=A0ABP3VNP4_9FLAO|nr:DNA methyltransferase [Psychroflexus lacisalsi]MBZ9621267.1 Eco57I restriction-modification methylase domain-containing protein [Psychroflexus lacisalsi]
MSLFQNSVLNKYLRGLESEKVNEAYERFTSHFHNPTIQENIRNSKEEQYQGEFLIDLFVNIFGYVKNPTPNFNLTTELKNVKDSKKTDGAILKGEKALAVIELKGTNTTDLSKVETQAFGYKNNQTGCNYVITSNFEKLRFYIDNAVDFEEFNLFQLTKERFDILWLCLSSEYLLKDIPKKIKDESLTQEEKITKELYKDYASFRNEVFESIQKENPEYDKLTLFKKTQKLLDRFLFIFFAEDRLLLPPNSIRSIVNQWTDLRDKYDEYFTLYDRFQKYFDYMNTGHKGQQHEIFAYNGGLFAPDEVLDNIKINDDLLFKHTVNLSNYDFESEVSVNILGHIFEHSLNDIDEIQSEIKGITTSQSKSKRKKDGVFYTPKYITKYIVDHTVGKLCDEKKTELDIQEAEYEKERKGRQKATLKKLAQKLEDYRKWLLQITICDPACGSGAFLNQALEFLILEHRYIDELQAKLFGDAMVLSEVENAILENNIYGVDINDESIDIAKLSLWLRTAQKGRKLTSLNDNIKCGNSLIDNKDIAGDKAFNWKEEFPEVFSKGGFDVIIGNPPYVSNKDMHRHGMQNQINHWNEKFESAKSGNYDIFIPFIEQGMRLVKENQSLSFIIPNKFLSAKYSKSLLNLISKDYTFDQVIDYSNINVFADASVYPIIITVSNIKQNQKEKTSVNRIIVEQGAFEEFGIHRKWDYINLKFLDSIDKESDSIISKIEKSKNTLNNELSFEPGINGFQFTNYAQCVTDGKVNEDSKRLTVTGSIDPHIFTNNITRYKKKDYVKPYITYDSEIISEGKWALFSRPKVMVAGMTKIIEASLDAEGKYAPAVSVYSICGEIENLYQVQLIINSKLINWFFRYKFSDKHMAGGYISVNNLLLQKIPLKKISDNTKTKLLVENSNFFRVELETVANNFTSLIKSKFEIEKVSRKLQNWYQFEFKDFLKELKKQKITISLNEEAEWMQYFKEQKEKTAELESKILQTDNEMDVIVYELYGLTEDEIKTVEKATT